MIQKICYKMYPLSYANTRHGVRNFSVDGMIRDTKHWISREQSITFPLNKKFFSWDYIFWNYFFLAEVTLKRCWYAPFFISKAFFPNQPQCCLSFSWIELQMLLRCCLIHVSIIILTAKTLYIYYICVCVLV